MSPSDWQDIRSTAKPAVSATLVAGLFLAGLCILFGAFLGLGL